MALPSFDEHGNLPPGRHEADVDDVFKQLIGAYDDSATRTGIGAYWRTHRAAVAGLVPLHEQWLAGSFTTAKTDPADVDVVSVIDGPAYDELGTERQLVVRMLLAGHYTEQFWACDVYPLLTYPEGHQAHQASRLCGERWEDYFGHDRDGRERGFVVVPG